MPEIVLPAAPKLQSDLRDDGLYGEDYAQEVWGGIQITGCSGSDPWGIDAVGTGLHQTMIAQWKRQAIEFIVGTAHLDGLLFDAGSGPFTVQVFPEVWDVLSSVSVPGSPPLPAIEGHAYDGTLLHVQGKLIPGTVTLGPKTLASPLVYELPENLRAIVSRRGAAGIVGDAAFLDQQVILDMRDPARFGVIDSAQHRAE
ncbi:hypothetical protein AD954_01915 [Acetobacter cerevisiae]|uniref:Uncharacterized protein n=1 Tax=Acetobacter cerevisiae TaxID=178900 RepID=A0A149VEM1_9PROT|nr:hypothetical protein AD954_01915 [Acetobacter cerevisiae]